MRFVEFATKNGTSFMVNPLNVSYVRGVGDTACHVIFAHGAQLRFEVPRDEAVRAIETALWSGPTDPQPEVDEAADEEASGAQEKTAEAAPATPGRTPKPPKTAATVAE